jgi:hypothetical protein
MWEGGEVGIEGCRKLCYCSPHIINIIIARKVIHIWNVACIQ